MKKALVTFHGRDFYFYLTRYLEFSNIPMSALFCILLQGGKQKNKCRLIPSEKMAGFPGYGTLAPKTKNLVMAGGLSAFVFGVYYYTMRAVGGSDELQVAIDKFEEAKHNSESEANLAPKP